jgi:hypothetical protein
MVECFNFITIDTCKNLHVNVLVYITCVFWNQMAHGQIFFCYLERVQRIESMYIIICENQIFKFLFITFSLLLQ